MVYFKFLVWDINIKGKTTYRVVKFGICDKNSGSGPVKLLFDKSLGNDALDLFD